MYHVVLQRTVFVLIMFLFVKIILINSRRYIIFSELEEVSAANDDRLRRWQEWALNRFIFPLTVLVFDQLYVRVPRMEIRYRLL